MFRRDPQDGTERRICWSRYSAWTAACSGAIRSSLLFVWGRTRGKSRPRLRWAQATRSLTSSAVGGPPADARGIYGVSRSGTYELHCSSNSPFPKLCGKSDQDAKLTQREWRQTSTCVRSWVCSGLLRHRAAPASQPITRERGRRKPLAHFLFASGAPSSTRPLPVGRSTSTSRHWPIGLAPRPPRDALIEGIRAMSSALCGRMHLR